MNISCDLCQAKYAVPDTKVRGRKVKITCKHCGATLIVDGTADEVSVVAVRDAGPANLATTALDRASPFADVPTPAPSPPPPAAVVAAPDPIVRSESPAAPPVMPATRPPSLPDDDAWAVPPAVPANPAPRFDFAGAPAVSPARESSRPPQGGVAVPAIAAPVAPAAGAQRLAKKTLLGGLDRPAPGAAPAPPPAPPPLAPPPPAASPTPSPAAAAAAPAKLGKKTMLGGLSAPLPSVRGVFDIDSAPDAAPTPLVPPVVVTPPAPPATSATATPLAPPTLATPSPSVAITSAPGTVAAPSAPETVVTSTAPSTLATPSQVAAEAGRSDTLMAVEPSAAAPSPLAVLSAHATQESPAFIQAAAPVLDIPVLGHPQPPGRELASTLPAMQAHPEPVSPARDVIPRAAEPRIDERSPTPAPARASGTLSSTLPQGVAPREAKKTGAGVYLIGALVLGSGAALGAYLADEGPAPPPSKSATPTAPAPGTVSAARATAATTAATSTPVATGVASVAGPGPTAAHSSPAPAPSAPAPSDGKPHAFDPAAANEALTTAAGSVATCSSPGRTASGKVAVIFANDGSVKHANVFSNEASVATKKCVERVFREAHIPAFVGAPVTVSRAFFVK